MRDLIKNIEHNQNIATCIIALLVMLTLTGNIAMDYYDIKNTKENYEDQLSKLKEAEWFFVEDLIYENYDKAKLVGGGIVSNITHNLSTAYNNKYDKLAYDISYLNPESDFSKIVANEVNKKYLNGIENDNNDPFVASKTGVLGDFSHNCSYETAQRSWEQEIELHWNKELGSKAIKSIVSQNGKYAFWEFLEPASQSHKVVTTMELNEIKKVFLHEGYRGIEGYEFLQPVYITDKGDILGTKDISNIGVKQETYKLIIVQGFNVVDIINAKHSKRPTQFQAMKEDLVKEYNRSIQDKQQKIIISIILMLSAFLSIARIQHLQNDK